MVKIVVSIALVSMLLLGCGQSAEEDVPSSALEPTPTPEKQPKLPKYPEPPPGEHTIQERGVISENATTGIDPGKVVIGGIEVVVVSEDVKVKIDKRYYPGYKPIIVPLQIHNGEGEERLFSVEFKVPDIPKRGYVRCPSYVENWVQISSNNITIGAHETAEVLIQFQMPKTAELWTALHLTDKGIELESMFKNTIFTRDQAILKSVASCNLTLAEAEKYVNELILDEYIIIAPAGFWEFYILVKDISQTTQIQTAHNQAWRIEMRL